MGLFTRRIEYDRRRLLRDAENADERRRYRKAATLYGQILAAEPNNPEIHARIAPVLARTGRHFEAWESFLAAANAPEMRDHVKSRIDLFKQAAERLPRSVDAWRRLAETFLEAQKPTQALRVLRTARPHFKSRHLRAQAVAILQETHRLEPWHPPTVLDLCTQLGKLGRNAEALYLLDELDRRVDDLTRSRARALAWRIDPTLSQTWKWWQASRAARQADLRSPRAPTRT